MATQRKGLNRIPGTHVTKPEVDFPAFDGTMLTEAAALRRVIKAVHATLGPDEFRKVTGVMHARLKVAQSAGQARDILLTWANDLND
jgi:hypothetical protein